MEYSLDSLPDNPTDNQIIDLILNILDNTSGSCYVFENYSSLLGTTTIGRIIKIMQYYNIAVVEGKVFGTYNYPLSLTPTGAFINTQGGWLAYMEHQERDRQLQIKRQAEAHQATLDSTKASAISASSAKSSARAAWITGAFTAISILLSVYQYLGSQSKDEEINALKIELQLLQKNSSTIKGQIELLTNLQNVKIDKPKPQRPSNGVRNRRR